MILVGRVSPGLLENSIADNSPTMLKNSNTKNGIINLQTYFTRNIFTPHLFRMPNKNIISNVLTYLKQNILFEDFLESGYLED